MYARLVIFEVGLEKRSTIEGLVEEFDALYRDQKGFRHVFIIADEASGEYGSFSVWESKEDAEAANAVIAPRLQQALSGLLEGQSDRWFLKCSNPRVTATNKRVPPGGSRHSPQCIHRSAWKVNSPKSICRILHRSSP